MAKLDISDRYYNSCVVNGRVVNPRATDTRRLGIPIFILNPLGRGSGIHTSQVNLALLSRGSNARAS